MSSWLLLSELLGSIILFNKADKWIIGKYIKSKKYKQIKIERREKKNKKKNDGGSLR